MSPKVATSASGTVTAGMTVAQTLRRNRKITMMTSAMVSSMVRSTSLTEARIVVVRSTILSTLMDAGTASRDLGSCSSTRATVSMTLAPGCLKTMSRMLRLPSPTAASLVFSGPSTATPISRIRIGAPFL